MDSWFEWIYGDFRAWSVEWRKSGSANCILKIDNKKESEVGGTRTASAPGPQGHGQNRSRRREEAERSAIPARNPPPHVGGYGVRAIFEHALKDGRAAPKGTYRQLK